MNNTSAGQLAPLVTCCSPLVFFVHAHGVIPKAYSALHTG